NKTLILTLIIKKNINLPIINYYETTNEISNEILNIIYFYEKNTELPIKLKKNKYIVTESNKYINDINLIEYPNINFEIIYDNNIEELNIILKNETYISNIDKQILINFSNLLFYY